jgi:hypothetical protein
MAVNSIQNSGNNAYLKHQDAKLVRQEQRFLEQQNQKAARTDLDKNAAQRVQAAFKLNISKKGKTMLKTSDMNNQDNQGNIDAITKIKPRTSQPVSAQKSSKIVNIIA